MMKKRFRILMLNQTQMIPIQKKESDIEYTAVELSHHVAGAHMGGEHCESITVWQNELGNPIHSIARAMPEAAQHTWPVRHL
jgi:hypothetical protein